MSPFNGPTIVHIIPESPVREVNILGFSLVLSNWCHHESRAEHILGTNVIDFLVLREIHCQRPHYGIIVKCHAACKRIEIRHQAITQTGVPSH